MKRAHSPACLCGARHWRLETLPVDDAWVGHCQDCGTERRWPTREPDTSRFPHYASPEDVKRFREYARKQAHAPGKQSQIAIKPATCERTW